MNSVEKPLLRIIIPAYPRFNIYSYIASRTTAIGPLAVATSANSLGSWRVEVIDENNFHNGKLNHHRLQKENPARVVGFYGGLTSTVPRIYKLAKLYKKSGAITIAGGQHFVEETIPEALSSGLDYIFTNEADITIKEFLLSLDKGLPISNIKGIVYSDREGNIVYTQKRPPINDLNTLPLIDFSLLRGTKLKLFPVSRVRGCIMNCEFCTVKAAPRCASAERFIQQIDLLVKNYRAKEFFIVDDLFSQDRQETLKLCHLLKKYQSQNKLSLSFTVQIRLDKARDRELLTLMREANIRVVCIGFESPIDEELKAMHKSLKRKDMLSLAKVFHEFGFFIHGMFIFAYPTENPLSLSLNQQIKYFTDFIKKASIDTVQVLLPVPLPGTELRKRLLKKKLLYPLSIVGWEYYDGNFPLFSHSANISAEEMQIGIRKIMGNFYNKKYFFLFFLNFLGLFTIPFCLYNLSAFWRRWQKKTRNYFYRIIGKIILNRWTLQLKKGIFLKKLYLAKEYLKIHPLKTEYLIKYE